MNTSQAEVEVTALAAGGDGVGRVDGMAVFIPRTAPGDRVLATLSHRGRFARGVVEQVLQPAPDRVDAPCIHFTRDACGGCQWQHLGIEAQRDAKATVVVDAFARIARLTVATPVVEGNNNTFGYRRTITLTVRGASRKRVGGFHAADDPDRIVQIGTCLIAHEDVQQAWVLVRRNLARFPETSRATRTKGRGAVRDDVRVSLRRLDSGDIAIVVQGGARWHGDDIAELAARVPMCAAIWWEPAGRDPRLVWNRDAATGAAHASAEALQVAASFVQVNAGVAAMLHSYVLAKVRSFAPRTVVDAYAGTGELAFALSQHGVQVTAIELDARASAYTAARLKGDSRAFAGTVESLLPSALPADVVVLNPPRSGVAEQVTAALSAARSEHDGPSRIVYVSCDPATLARDVARLEGWRVQSLHCFDMFPQTAHVETVCVLQPEAS